jgi:hypothetical protein
LWDSARIRTTAPRSGEIRSPLYTSQRAERFSP